MDPSPQPLHLANTKAALNLGQRIKKIKLELLITHSSHLIILERIKCIKLMRPEA